MKKLISRITLLGLLVLSVSFVAAQDKPEKCSGPPSVTSMGTDNSGAITREDFSQNKQLQGKIGVLIQQHPQKKSTIIKSEKITDQELAKPKESKKQHRCKSQE